jgi:hypothetical protein
MRPADTSPEVFAYHLDRLRQLGSAGRSRMAAELSDTLRQTALADIRRRHPEYSDAEVARTFVKAVYGIDRKR